METTLRQIEILTNAWDTISNMSIDDDILGEYLDTILDKLTKRILDKTDSYLKSGK